MRNYCTQSLAAVTLQFSVEVYPAVEVLQNWISDRFLGFFVNLIGYFQLRKSIIQTALKGRAFPILIGTSVPETMVSPIIAPLGCKIYLFSPSP